MCTVMPLPVFQLPTVSVKCGAQGYCGKHSSSNSVVAQVLTFSDLILSARTLKEGEVLQKSTP